MGITCDNVNEYLSPDFHGNYVDLARSSVQTQLDYEEAIDYFDSNYSDQKMLNRR